MSEETDRIAELEAELERRDQRMKELREELIDAREIADRMREHVEDVHNSIDNWISVLDLQRDDDGLWMFDPKHSDLWRDHADLIEKYNKLIREFNKLVGKWNLRVAPLAIGRPLAASDAQKTEVLKRHKDGRSLRSIAVGMTLGLRTVRTIVDQAEGQDRTSKRRSEVRKLELNRQRAMVFRSRQKRRLDIPKGISKLQKDGAALVKRAKAMPE